MLSKVLSAGLLGIDGYLVEVEVDIANGLGLISVSNTNKWGSEWQIEGYDVAGSYMEVDIDARTGAVVDVDR